MNKHLTYHKSVGIVLTFITMKHSLILVTLTYGVINGFGNGKCGFLFHLILRFI